MYLDEEQKEKEAIEMSVEMYHVTLPYYIDVLYDTRLLYDIRLLYCTRLLYCIVSLYDLWCEVTGAGGFLFWT